jgi:hypothetical protein
VREALARALNPTGSALENILEYNGQNWDKVEEDPSVENKVKWITMGIIDINRMVNNDRPLSLDHWMANINAGLFAYSLYSSVASAAATNAATKAMVVPKGTISSASSGQGFSTFNELKKAIGSPGAGNHWHHIVEQSQVNKSGFSSDMIQNTNNIIAVDKATHAKISGYYGSIDSFTNGMRVRDWLAGQSFETQYQFGVDVLKRYGSMP